MALSTERGVVETRRLETLSDEWFRIAGRREPVSAERERELLTAVAAGRADDADDAAKSAAKAARDELIECNIRYVISVAMRFRRSRVGLDDMISAGCVGLAKSIDAYDLNHRTRLLTYAAHGVRRTIVELVAEMAGVARVPIQVHAECALGYRGRRTRKPEDVERARRTRVYQGLHTHDGQDRDCLADGRPDVGHDLEARETLSLVSAAMVRRLDARQRAIVERRYGLDDEGHSTQHDLAGRFGITMERVRQIEKESLATLRRAFA